MVISWSRRQSNITMIIAAVLSVQIRSQPRFSQFRSDHSRSSPQIRSDHSRSSPQIIAAVPSVVVIGIVTAILIRIGINLCQRYLRCYIGCCRCTGRTIFNCCRFRIVECCCKVNKSPVQQSRCNNVIVISGIVK